MSGTSSGLWLIEHRPPYLLHFAIIHKLSAIFTKGQWMWIGTNYPEKVIHNLSAISVKGQLFMNRYHFDDQFLSKKWYIIWVPPRWRVNYLWIGTIFLVGTEIHHRMQKSNYFRRVVSTESEGEGLYRAVVHTNAYNI